MSLFGDEGQSGSKSSIFEETSTTPNRSSKPGGPGGGLFASDAGGEDSSWGMPTPKRQARANLVKTLLSPDEVPEIYIDAFDALLSAGSRIGPGSVSGAGARQLLDGSGLTRHDAEAISNIVSPSGLRDTDGLGRGEFNVLLALIGLAQRREDISLDSVDEHRKSITN